jgi:hypothetical protein
MGMNEEFMIYDLRFAISKARWGRNERGAVPFKSSIINHQS